MRTSRSWRSKALSSQRQCDCPGGRGAAVRTGNLARHRLDARPRAHGAARGGRRYGLARLPFFAQLRPKLWGEACPSSSLRSPSSRPLRAPPRTPLGSRLPSPAADGRFSGAWVAHEDRHARQARPGNLAESVRVFASVLAHALFDESSRRCGGRGARTQGRSSRRGRKRRATRSTSPNSRTRSCRSSRGHGPPRTIRSRFENVLPRVLADSHLRWPMSKARSTPRRRYVRRPCRC